MTHAQDEFWSSVPDPAYHPARVPIIEALWWIGTPLTPLGLVDVLDGFVSTMEASYHLRALDELGVVELATGEPAASYEPAELIDQPYRLAGEPNHGGH